MKKAASLVIAIAFVFVFNEQSQGQTNLASLGSDNYSVILTNFATVSQTATTLTFSPTSIGGLFGGSFTTAYDWSGYSDTNTWNFGMFMTVPGSSYDQAVTMELYSSVFDLLARYQGATPSDSTPSFVSMVPVAAVGSGILTEVGAVQLTWDNPDPGSVIIDGVGVVPEPTTWAMLIFGAALLGGLAVRRRLSAARR